MLPKHPIDALQKIGRIPAVIVGKGDYVACGVLEADVVGAGMTTLPDADMTQAESPLVTRDQLVNPVVLVLIDDDRVEVLMRLCAKCFKQPAQFAVPADGCENQRKVHRDPTGNTS